MKLITRSFVMSTVTAMMFMFLVLSGRPAAALEVLDGKLQIHGFGHQGFLITDHNKWQGADSKGSFDFNNFGLLVTALPTEDLTIASQFFADDEEEGVRFDWAFVDYKFSDQLRIRGGQIRDPAGLLSETRDIKYLQLSTIKPYIYQDESEMVQKAFRGASLIYTPQFLNDALSFELYGGQPVVFEGENAEEDPRDLVALKVTYKTPLDGLSLLATASTAKETSSELGISGRVKMAIGSVSYVNHDLDLKAEYAWQKDINEFRYGYYAQAGYTFFDKLTPFVRYDNIVLERDERSDPSKYQKGFVVGVGYKFNNYVSFKVENHFISGFGLPASREVGEELELNSATNEIETEEKFEMENGRKHWNLFAASLNFIF